MSMVLPAETAMPSPASTTVGASPSSTPYLKPSVRPPSTHSHGMALPSTPVKIVEAEAPEALSAMPAAIPQASIHFFMYTLLLNRLIERNRERLSNRRAHTCTWTRSAHGA